MDPQPPECEPDAEGARSGDGADDSLRRLEERLGRASEAAERLIAEAAGTVGRAADSVGRLAGTPGGASGADAGGGTGAGSMRGGGTPAAGWQIPHSEEGAARGADLEVLSQIFGSLRELIPPELQRRLAEALRELLTAIRALIDWYLERTERKRAEPSEVQDIPIL